MTEQQQCEYAWKQFTGTITFKPEPPKPPITMFGKRWNYAADSIMELLEAQIREMESSLEEHLMDQIWPHPADRLWFAIRCPQRSWISKVVRKWYYRICNAVDALRGQ